MEQLVIKSSKGNPITNTLLVAEKFGKQHKYVIEGVKHIISSAENSAQFYHLSSYVDSTGKSNKMYVMNRDGFSLLVMGFTGSEALKFKISFIEAFNKMEEHIKLSQSKVPASFSEALELAAKQQKEIEEQNRIIAIQTPKAAFVDRVIDSGNLVDVGQAAKLLKLTVGRNRFFQILRNKGIFFKNRNEPKQEYIERGYFELRENEIARENHPSLMVTKVLVTQKGLYWLSRVIAVPTHQIKSA